MSEYHVNESAATDGYFKNVLTHLLSKAALKPDTLATLRQYFSLWACWLRLGLSSLTMSEGCLQTILPSITSYWIPGGKAFTLFHSKMSIKNDVVAWTVSAYLPISVPPPLLLSICRRNSFETSELGSQMCNQKKRCVHSRT